MKTPLEVLNHARAQRDKWAALVAEVEASFLASPGPSAPATISKPLDFSQEGVRSALRSYIASTGLTVNQVSKITEIAGSTLSRWLSGGRVPDRKSLLRIAHYDKANAGYWTACADHCFDYKAVASETLNALRRRESWTLEEIAKKVGVRMTMVSDWSRGKYFPCPANCTKLAEIDSVGAAIWLRLKDADRSRRSMR